MPGQRSGMLRLSGGLNAFSVTNWLCHKPNLEPVALAIERPPTPYS